MPRKKLPPIEVGMDPGRPGDDLTGLAFYWGGKMLAVFSLDTIGKTHPDRNLPEVYDWFCDQFRNGEENETNAAAFCQLMAKTGITVDADVLRRAWRKRYGQ